MVRLLKAGKGKNEPSLPPQQEEEYTKIQNYLQEKQLPQLFNRLLTQLIHDRPPDVKQYLMQQLNQIKYYQNHPDMEQPVYFNAEEFELMFDNYEETESKVDFEELLHALTVAGVKNPQQALSEEFPELSPETPIPRATFVNVLQTLFPKKGYD